MARRNNGWRTLWLVVWVSIVALALLIAARLSLGAKADPRNIPLIYHGDYKGMQKMAPMIIPHLYMVRIENGTTALKEGDLILCRSFLMQAEVKGEDGIVRRYTSSAYDCGEFGIFGIRSLEFGGLKPKFR
jgi:hypothetical protein